MCTFALNRKLLGEYIDKEAELSGSEGGASDEDLDFGEEGDLLELEQGDMEDVGTDEQLRSQVAKAHAYVFLYCLFKPWHVSKTKSCAPFQLYRALLTFGQLKF